MKYKVSKQYARGPESFCAQFADVNDAKFFIQARLADDAALNVKVIYKIYEFTELLQEFDPANPNAAASGASSSGKSSEANFRPSPLSVAPRPSGMPQNWRKDDDEDKKK
jgi:hypothetical protein